MVRAERYSYPGAVSWTKISVHILAIWSAREHNVALHQGYSLKDKQNKRSQTVENLTHSGRDHVEYC